MKLFDPTSAPVAREVQLAPRRADLRGLRVGLVENTKFNSAAILKRLGDRLEARYGMTIVTMTTKRSASHSIDETQIESLRKQADVVVSGIGD